MVCVVIPMVRGWRITCGIIFSMVSRFIFVCSLVIVVNVKMERSKGFFNIVKVFFNIYLLIESFIALNVVEYIVTIPIFNCLEVLML